eukprot:TRINITY_DN377_c0_g1_i3.p1 TRINITY_DN377_c0_g1~~TRINITY_DN377_c0_g1_i3.p1  ORF type:complete len:623 (-),score=226.40 TRINITY_DN377_c0_g1_i3:189-2018(-)
MARRSPKSLLWVLLAVLLIAYPLTKVLTAVRAEGKASSSEEEDSDDNEGTLPIQEEAEPDVGESALTEPYVEGGEGEGGYNEGEEGGEAGAAEGEEPEEEEDVNVDEKDVVVLTGATFNDTIAKTAKVLVEFYAPWCGHCKSLKPAYAKAATILKEYDDKIVLAKVDAAQETDLGQDQGVEGFPTLYWYDNGVKLSYTGGRSVEEIVQWVKKKAGPPAETISTAKEMADFIVANRAAGVGFFNKFEGKEWEHFQQLAKNQDSLAFVQTTSAEAAAAAGITAKAPAFAIVKSDDEKFTAFDGEFAYDELSKFVAANKLPIVTMFTTGNAEMIFSSAIKRQALLFLPADKEAEILPLYKKACSELKGDVICVHVKADHDDSSQVYEFFGLALDDVAIFGYSTLEESKKFPFEKELTHENIVAWGKDFAAGKIEASFKSEEIPEKNDEDVKVVVGKTFESIVLDESKDVLLEVYAPWCGHCQSLEPVYKKLAKKFRDIPSVVIAKIDGTANEHPRLEVQGFPTILLFKVGAKDEEPIPFEGDRTVKEMTKFLKENCGIPFILEKKKKKAQAVEVEVQEAKAEEKELAKDAAAEEEGKEEVIETIKSSGKEEL